jgi:hypothetical protein
MRELYKWVFISHVTSLSPFVMGVPYAKWVVLFTGISFGLMSMYGVYLMFKQIKNQYGRN